MMTLLRASNMQSSEFATVIGVSPTYFKQMKKGKDNGGRNIGNSIAKRIEKAFEKPAKWLDLDHSPKKPRQTEPEPAPPSSDEMEMNLLETSAKLSPEQKDQLIISLMGVLASQQQR